MQSLDKTKYFGSTMDDIDEMVIETTLVIEFGMRGEESDRSLGYS